MKDNKYNLYSGLIPATLFQKLYFKEKSKKLPIFKFSTTRERGVKEKEKYEITFNDHGKKIVSIIQEDFNVFLKKNHLQKNIKILLIDASISSGFTIAYFIEVLKKINLKTENITLVITDIQLEKKKLKLYPRNFS